MVEVEITRLRKDAGTREGVREAGGGGGGRRVGEGAVEMR